MTNEDHLRANIEQLHNELETKNERIASLECRLQGAVKMSEMRGSGSSIRDIARTFGVSNSTVRTRLLGL